MWVMIVKRKPGGMKLRLRFPYGAFVAAGRAFRRHPIIKILIIAVIVGTVVAIPLPKRARDTRIVLVGEKPAAKVFGPEIPEDYEAREIEPIDADTDLLANTSESGAVYVYASATEGKNFYHTSLCKYAFATSRKMTLYEAYMLGYTTPCNLCDPPVYTPGED